MSYVKWGLLAGIGIVLAALAHYTLPTYDVVWVSKTRESIEDRGGTNNDGTPVSGPTDVLLISAFDENNNPRVYRNEDVFWFFKFDSSDLDAQAERMKSTEENPRWVAIHNYGWRINMLSMYPNALSITEVEGPDDAPFPVTMVIMIVIFLVVVFLLWRLFGRLFGGRST